MQIEFEKLTDMLKDAYDLGVSGCPELKNQDVEALLLRFGIDPSCDLKIWSVEDLLKMPDGALFNHFTKGRCFIASKADGTKYMQFQSAQVVELVSNTDPWDKPMRLISMD